MISQLLNFQQKSISSAALILGASALLSRLLGIVRDRLLAGTFGAGKDLDAYLAAFRIPDFLYAFLVIWGLSAVFLPLFSEYMAQDKAKAWKFVNAMMAVYAIALGVGGTVAFFFMPQLVSFIAPGFEGEQLQTAVLLSRIMLLSPLFFAFSAIASGVLQYFQRFVAYALAPILYNLGIIIGILFLAPHFGIVGVALGVVVGAVAHVLIQLPSFLATGFTFRPVFELLEPQVKKAFLLSIPRTIAGVAHQINLVVMVAFASLLPVGSITIFSLAEHMYYFPVGVIGVPLATAAFPLMSKAAAKLDIVSLTATLRSALWNVSVIALPAAAVLFVVREPLFRLLYLSGEFGETEVKLVASVFGVFALGIVFQAVIPLLVRAFFALQNTWVPTIVGVGSVVLNIALAYTLINLGWGVIALPAALVFSGAAQSLLLALLLFTAIRSQRYARNR